MIRFFSTTIYTGPVAHSLGGGGISPFVGFPIAAALYYILSRNLDVAAEQRLAEQQLELLEGKALLGVIARGADGGLGLVD